MISRNESLRVGTTRRIGYFTAAFFSTFLLVILLVVPVNTTFSSQTLEEEQFPQSIIASSSTDTTPHALELKAIQDEDNAEPRRVSGFKLDMTNVVTAQINSQLLVFVTDSSVRVLEAKVRTVSDQLLDLVPSSQANAFSLANLPTGVYTLDVITQKGNTKAAYEGILVISQQQTTIINETTKQIINQEINQNTRVDIRIIFKEKEPKPKPPSPCYFDPSLEECKPKNGKCPPGFGFNEDEQCIPHGKCPDGYGRLDDDETGKCYKNSDIKKCPDGYITHKSAECPKPPPVTPPVNSCGCPIGENCPAVVCDQPPGEKILPPTPTLTPTPPNEELPPSPPPDTIPPIDEEQPPPDEQLPTPPLDEQPPDEQLLPSDEEISPPDDNTPSEDEEPPEEEGGEDEGGANGGDEDEGENEEAAVGDGDEDGGGDEQGGDGGDGDEGGNGGDESEEG